MIKRLNPHISCHLDVAGGRVSCSYTTRYVCTHALACTHIHSDPFLGNRLNDLLSLPLFFLSLFLTLPPPSTPPLCADSQVVSSCQKHTLILTHGWQRETEGARDSTGLTHTHKKKEAAGHLGSVPCCSAAVLESANGSPLRQDFRKPVWDKGVVPTPHCPRDKPMLGQCKGLAGLGLGPWGCYFGGMGDTPAGSSAVTIVRGYH